MISFNYFTRKMADELNNSENTPDKSRNGDADPVTETSLRALRYTHTNGTLSSRKFNPVDETGTGTLQKKALK